MKMIDEPVPFESIPEEVTAEISEVITYIFEKTFIMSTVYNPSADREKDNPVYEKCADHEDNIRAILKLAGYELKHDYQIGVYYITAPGRTKTLSKDMTYILIALRSIYEKEMESGIPTRRIQTTKQDIRIALSDMGLLTEELKRNKARWLEVFGHLKQKQVINYAGNKNDMEDDTPIYISHTIRIVVSEQKMEEFISLFRPELNAIEAERDENDQPRADEISVEAAAYVEEKKYA